MSDQNDNIKKDNGQSEDAEFALAELRFLIRGFRRGSDDSKALLIAKSIKNIIGQDIDFSPAKEILEEMENYSSESQSDDFIWELVYVRRKLAQYCGSREEAAENRYIGAKHFERICEVAPSRFNKFCRIQEYVTAANFFMLADGQRNQKRIESILDYAEEQFVKIEEASEEMYYATGEYLYLNKYLSLIYAKVRGSERLETVKKTVEYSRKHYMIDKSAGTLKTLAMAYLDYTEDEDFSFSEEEENLVTLVEWCWDAVSKGNTALAKYYDKLNKKLKSFRNN